MPSQTDQINVQKALEMILSRFKELPLNSTPPRIGKWAENILNVQRKTFEIEETGAKGLMQMLPLQWKERVRSAGLNPDNPMEVVDQRLWESALKELCDTGTFQGAPTLPTEMANWFAGRKKPPTTR